MSSQGPPNPESPSGTALLPRRRRARQACLACRQRKRKCDMQLPCSMCTAYSYKCRYSKDDGPSAAFVDRPRPVTSSSGPTPESLSASPNFTVKSPPNHEPRLRSVTPVGEPGILDPFKARYMSQSSAVAFPRSLGIDLQSPNPPPLHSFGWNCGIRAEEKSGSHCSLTELISEEDIRRFSDVYFTAVHPQFAGLDQQNYLQRCQEYVTSTTHDIGFGAIIGGVVALGSFFSVSQGHRRELDIVQYTKVILEDPNYSRLPSIDQVAAWILRTIYLRATTRPHSAWLASCTTLHLAEATGLHQEVNAVLLTTSNNAMDAISSNQSGAEHARRLFWCAWSLNTIISYEYGRSAIHLSSITCAPIVSVPGSFAVHQYQLAHLVPPPGSSTRKSDLCKAISDLDTVADDHPFITLTKADLCFCFYRRLRLLKADIPKLMIQSIIHHGNATLLAAQQLIIENRPWWNTLGSVFQFVCILLAIDTSDSLEHVSTAMDALEKIVQLLRTHLAVEALTTARLLLKDSMAKKRRELGLLEVADDKELQPVEIATNVEFDWDGFFETSYAQFLGDGNAEYNTY